MLAKRRLSVATVAVLAGATWAVFLAPGSHVAAAPATGDTVRASVYDGSPGAESPQGGGDSSISGDGRYDVFVSDTPDLAPGPGTICPCDNTASRGVYVRDLQTGHTDLVSIGKSDTGTVEPPNNHSDYPSISADGRYVAFVTDATDIVRPDNDKSATVVVCDRGPPNANGVYQSAPAAGQLYPASFVCVAVASVSTPLNGNADGWPRLSGDGTRIVWGDSNKNQTSVADIPHDANGAPLPPTDVVSLNQTAPGFSTISTTQPAISADGAWAVTAAQADAKTNDSFGIIEYHLGTNDDPRRVDETPDGKPAGTSDLRVGHPQVSDGGATVVFDTDDQYPAVYAVDVASTAFGGTDADLTVSSTLVSRTADGTVDGQPGDGAMPALSADGRYVAFVTDQPGMADAPEGELSDSSCLFSPDNEEPNDRTICQVVARDLLVDADREGAGKPRLFAALASATAPDKLDCQQFDSPPVQQCPGNDASEAPVSLSNDGAQVGFDSLASDLVDGDNNAQTYDFDGVDAFVRTWTPSLRTPDRNVGSVHVGHGKTIKYTITGTGFGPQAVTGVHITNETGDGLSVDDSGCGGGSTPDNPFILHEGDTCTVTVIFAPTQQGPVRGELSVDTDGKAPAPAVFTGTALPPLPTHVRDIVRTSVGSGDPGTQGDTGSSCSPEDFSLCSGSSMVSGNGRYDVFASADPLDGTTTDGHTDIYVRDLVKHTTTRISVGADVSAGKGPVIPNGTIADGDSFQPSISANGRLVSFLTEARNVVPISGQFQNRSIVVVCDRDPDGDGVFDEPQAGHPDRPDFRCFAVHNAYSFAYNQSPRLAPDGRHLVYIDCPTNPSDTTCFNTDNARENVVLVSLPRTEGQPVTHISDPIVLTSDNFNTNFVSRDQPQVSNGGISDDPNGVRVAYTATSTGTSAIFVDDVVDGESEAPHRIDRKPNGNGFLGQTEGPDVSNPSMTDDGTMVAFDYEDFFGTSRVYVADVDGRGRATTRAIHTKGLTGPLARGADPALSGDGRYISYVTDSPNFDNTAPVTPDESCLNDSEDEEVAGAQDIVQSTCQIVARDLVQDAQRSRRGLPPLPDALVTESANDCSTAPTVFGSTCGGDGDSLDPTMSKTGFAVGFDSYADDLVPNDTNASNSSDNRGLDAFVRFFFPQAVLSPVDFGDVPVGSSSSQSSTLTVTGFGPYTLAGATVGGADPGDFTVTGGTCALPGQVLHLGEVCDLTITFTPGGNGPRSGTITISGANNPNTTTITVTGTGANTTAPMFSANPDPVRFGAGLPLDKPGRTRTLKVTNGGGSPLILSQVTVVDSTVPGASDDYTVDLSKCNFGVIPPGKSCQIKISWVGHAVGLRPAILRVVDNAPGGLQVVRLRASVPSPTISMSPNVVPTGHLTQVTGKGFAPKRNVLITLPDAGGSAVGRTDRHGEFSTALVTFPNGITGHLMVDVRSAHADKSISAQKKLLVTLGTLQSPTLVIRH